MNKYTKKNTKILTEITTFCENECAERECCIENECILWRIEKLITKDRDK